MRISSTAKRSRKTSARAALFALAALVLMVGGVRSQVVPIPADDLKARIERLEAELKELKTTFPEQLPAPVGLTGMPEPQPAAKAAKAPDPKKPEEKKPQTSVVGDDTKLNASFDAGGLRYKTADEAFSVHFGGRLMTDEVWWTQSPNLPQVANATGRLSILPTISGVGPGIGNLLDGFFLRRARVVADGTIHQVIEFKSEIDVENYTSLAFDESYIGIRDLPLIDTIRLGQMHVPFGLEAYASSRWLSTLERSPSFDAFYQEFAPGIFSNTTFLDQRVTTQHMFHRIDNFSQFNGASFGDGKYAYSGRVSVLPVYEWDGRCLLHLGLAYQWRKGSIPSDFNSGTTLATLPNPAVTTNTDLVRFRARPSIRDAVGAQGNGTRVVDTGNIIADDVQSLNGEWLSFWGPLSVQAEATWAHVDNAVFPASSAATKRGDLDYYGTYIQVGYFLTGENRGYDKRFGKHDRVRPLENFFLVRGEDGCIQYGWGAWELIYRYGYIDLDSDNVQGGRYGEHTIGVNWYWTSNVKFQFNYINGQRNVPDGAVSGTVQGFGLRGALEY